MTWLIKNWKVVAVLLLVAALAITGWKLYRAGGEAATVKAQLENQTNLADFYREQSVKFAASLQDHAKRTQEDTAKITELNRRITSLNDYVDTLQDRDRECLSGPDVERLRDLWNDPSPSSGTPASATR